MTFKVVLTHDIAATYDPEAFKRIGARWVKNVCRTEDEIIAAAHDADAVISLTLRQPFPRRVIERLENCKIIASIGIGYEKVDLTAATERGICVSNVPDVGTQEVSDHTMACLLACARRLFYLDKAVRDGLYDSPAKAKIKASPMARVSGQTLGLVGFGQIPRALVPKALGFRLKIIAYSPTSPLGPRSDYDVEMVPLERVLKESDFVSLHAAATATNRHMLGMEQFRMMKPTAFFINTARGVLVDEQALYMALAEGCIAGAALDVTDPDPPSLDNPLLQLPNVIFTPHLASFSDAGRVEGLRRPSEEVVKVLTGEWPFGFVNPEVKKTFRAKWGALKATS